jgi:hypothetical protein
MQNCFFFFFEFQVSKLDIVATTGPSYQSRFEDSLEIPDFQVMARVFRKPKAGSASVTAVQQGVAAVTMELSAASSTSALTQKKKKIQNDSDSDSSAD